MNHFLEIGQLSAQEAENLLQLAVRLKQEPLQAQRAYLPNQQLALLFEKPSLRTRVSFEVAMRQLGGETLYLSPQEVGLGGREDVGDVARVLSRYVSGVAARVFSHRVLLRFADAASVPVVNGLSDRHHPCQGLADALTIREHLPDHDSVRVAYVGDGNNVAISLMQICVLLGWEFRVATPTGYEIPDGFVPAEAKGTVLPTHDPREAVAGADVVYTDVWTSMGQESEMDERRRVFPPYQLNLPLLRLAQPRVLVMHCMPAHRGEEITEDILYSPQSVVIDQAENRLHAQKAVLLTLMQP